MGKIHRAERSLTGVKWKKARCAGNGADLPEATVTPEWYALTPRKRNNIGSDAKTS